MSTQLQDLQSRDPWASRRVQGISVRATLAALVIAFLGIAILGALLVGGTPVGSDRRADRMPAEPPSTITEAPERSLSGSQTLSAGPDDDPRHPLRVPRR